MKRTTYAFLSTLLLFSLFLGTSVYSQDCPPDNVTFSSQQDIDSFAILYPNCTDLNGGIFVEKIDTGEIFNLNGLSKIKTVGKFIQIKDNANLKSLRGLDQLTHVGGGLSIINNDSLVDLNGLNSLTQIDSL